MFSILVLDLVKADNELRTELHSRVSSEPLITRKFKDLIWSMFISYCDAWRSVLLEWPPYDEEIRGPYLARIYHTMARLCSSFTVTFSRDVKQGNEWTNEFPASWNPSRSRVRLKVRCPKWLRVFFDVRLSRLRIPLRTYLFLKYFRSTSASYWNLS